MILNKISNCSKKIYRYQFARANRSPPYEGRRWIIKSHNISKQINMTPLTRRYQFARANRSPPAKTQIYIFVFSAGTPGTGLVRGKEGTIIGKMG